MSRIQTARYLIAGVLLVSLTSLSCQQENKTRTEEKLVVQFGWLFDAHHLGFLWAQHRGYYRHCGSSVELLPGGLDSSPAKSVLSGVADIGQFSGPEQLLTARAEGLPVIAVAAFHRRSPHALISLERVPIRTPKDLVGRTVAVAFGDAAELHFRALLSRSGIPQDAVRTVPFRFDLTPLMRGEVDAITGFATDQPVTLREQGKVPVVLPYYDAGLSSYGYMFFVKEHPKKSSQIECFLEESRRGWREVFQKPADAIRYLCKERLPNSSCTAEARKLELLRPIMLGANGVLATWSVSVEGLAQAEEELRSFGQLTKEVSLETVFDNTLITAAEEAVPQ